MSRDRKLPYIKLKQLTKNKPKLFKLISITSSNASNKVIRKYVIDNYHMNIYDSSIALFRHKIRLSQAKKLSIVDLLQGKQSTAKPLKTVNPLSLLNQEVARIYRNSITNTLSLSDKRELIQLLRISMKRSWIDYDL